MPSHTANSSGLPASGAQFVADFYGKGIVENALEPRRRFESSSLDDMLERLRPNFLADDAVLCQARSHQFIDLCGCIFGRSQKFPEQCNRLCTQIAKVNKPFERRPNEFLNQWTFGIQHLIGDIDRSLQLDPLL